MQGGLVARKVSVYLLSAKCVNYDKMEEKSVKIFNLSIFLYHMKDHLASFLRKRMVGGNPLYLKFWVSRPHWSKIADFELIFARSASAVTPVAKRVQLTLIGSPLRAFQ